MTKTPFPVNATYQAEYAVIEAAKAKNHLERCIKKPDWSGCVATALQEADERIRAAVEALEEVER